MRLTFAFLLALAATTIWMIWKWNTTRARPRSEAWQRSGGYREEYQVAWSVQGSGG
jgi:hypothetical protein